MPPSSATAGSASAQGEVNDAAALAAAAAAGGDRAATAAVTAAPRSWGASKTGQLVTGQRSLQGGGAEANNQLQIKHVADLLSKEYKPILPDDDSWVLDIVWDKEQANNAVAAAALGTGTTADTRQLQQLQQQGGRDAQQQLTNGVLLSGAEGGANGRVKVLWDLNDPNMVFEAPNTVQFSTASAVVQQAAPKVVIHLPPHLLAEQDPLMRDLAPLHVSRDHLYITNERQAGRTTGTGKHSQLAIGLNLLPTFPKDAYTAFWHRPRHWWSAPSLLFALVHRQDQRDLAAGGRGADTSGKLKFECVSLTLKKGLSATAPDADADLCEVWQVVSAARFFRDAIASEVPRLFGQGPEYIQNNGMGAWLNPDSPLNHQGFTPGVNFIVPVWSQLQPLKTTAYMAKRVVSVHCS
eukprot:GHRR01025374.1.p1 GENE.GHRR01025374.1~~GHRR01025374.1.p1  ORF type:complete len:409 (+),score=173.80 GHRR01025374.1:1-1227(+)